MKLIDTVYNSVPKDVQEGLNDYILFGLEPEGYLRAVICGNLYDAFHLASMDELRTMSALVKLIESHVPSHGYGSEAKMMRYLDTHPNRKELA